jgi:hypothetical protein
MQFLFFLAFVIGLTMSSAFEQGFNTSSSTCGGNCPGGCSSCPCGTSSSYQDIASWCSKYSWNQKNCQCIMNAESRGNAHAANENSDGSFDVGLWQINDYNWNSCSGGSAPCDPSSNLNCAKKVYQWGGNTWKLWSTCSKCGCCSSS